MKTTLNLDDRILCQAKAQAAKDGITLARFVEDALRARLKVTSNPDRPFRLRLKTVAGERPPNVDICDRDALHEVIDQTCWRSTPTS